jgi:hypothetical protein
MASSSKTSSTPKLSTVSARVEKKIVPASELYDPVKMLVYARPKTGKTRLAASAPGVLLIDVNERGTKSIRRDFNPQVFPVTSWGDMDDIYWYLKEGSHEFKTVSLDGLTGLATLAMNFVLGEQVALDASRDPDMPTRQAWGKTGQLMKTQITNFRNLDMNVVFTALVRANRTEEDDDDLSGEITFGPAVSPSVSNHLEAAVDIIGYLVKRQVIVKRGDKRRKVTRRRLILEGSERYLVGERSGTLPAFIDAPNLTELFKTINQEESSLDGQKDQD